MCDFYFSYTPNIPQEGRERRDKNHVKRDNNLDASIRDIGWTKFSVCGYGFRIKTRGLKDLQIVQNFFREYYGEMSL